VADMLTTDVEFLLLCLAASVVFTATMTGLAGYLILKIVRRLTHATFPRTVAGA
jgi:hypothetical protein